MNGERMAAAASAVPPPAGAPALRGGAAEPGAARRQGMEGQGGAGHTPAVRRRRRGGLRIAAVLAAAPAAVVLAVAMSSAAHEPASDLPQGYLFCLNSRPPPYDGYEEEIRATVARGGHPGPITSSGEHVEYLVGNSRIDGTGYLFRDVAFPGPPVPAHLDGATAIMAMTAIVNWQSAPPGQCVWEHEYIAWGGNLTELEYDEDLLCYLAGDAGGRRPAPYELADEETRALIERTGPAPAGAGAFGCYSPHPDSPRLCVEPAPNGTAAFEYVMRNTRAELFYGGAGPAAGGDPYPERFYGPDGFITGAHIPRPRVLYGAEFAVAEALHHTGGDAYRAVKMLNRDYFPMNEECVGEGYWAVRGNSLSGLEYLEEDRCYLAPAEVGALSPDDPCRYLDTIR